MPIKEIQISIVEREELCLLLAWICLFLTVSVLSLFVAWLFTREVVGSDTATPAMQHIAASIKFAKRHYKTVAALICLMLPTFAFAQSEHAGGEASLTLPDLKSVNFANFGGLNGHALLSIGLLFCVGGSCSAWPSMCN